MVGAWRTHPSATSLQKLNKTTVGRYDVMHMPKSHKITCQRKDIFILQIHDAFALKFSSSWLDKEQRKGIMFI
jgi:hypothetical protein